MASSTMTASKRLASALIGTLLGVVVMAGVGITLHSHSKDPNGILKATETSETIDIDGKTYKKATIELGVRSEEHTSELQSH